MPNNACPFAKKDESIMIGDQVEIKILAVEGDQIKLGIVAPKTVKVHRSEVLKQYKLKIKKLFLQQLTS